MIKVAAGILIQPARAQVLLCQRKRTSSYALKWEFPGGKVKDEESIPHCLQRELREELNIDAAIGELYYRHQYVYPDSGTYDVYYHLVPSHSGKILNRVFESFAWVPLTDLRYFDILEGNTDVVEKLMKDHETIAAGKS